MARIGKPRRMVVEAAPSHDGSQTFAAWHGSDPRPLFALRIYDTTPEAASADHLHHVAKVIYENTWKHRASVGRGQPDRIEVVGMPMAAATDEERARRCREHHEAEVASRIRAASREWYIPTTRTESSYWSHIKVLKRLSQGVRFSIILRLVALTSDAHVYPSGRKRFLIFLEQRGSDRKTLQRFKQTRLVHISQSHGTPPRTTRMSLRETRTMTPYRKCLLAWAG